MERAVPSGKSFLGCGTITMTPSLLNLWCDPLLETNAKPSAKRRLTIFLLSRSIGSITPTLLFGQDVCKKMCIVDLWFRYFN
jgi:hypothetical protein